MSIFEDKEWSKDEIIDFFGSFTELIEQQQISRLSSNGEVKYKGWWFHYYELNELIKIMEKENVK